MKLYKVLNEDGSTPQGYGRWNLDGNWMPVIKGDLVACKNGYHLMREQDLVYWLGEEIWEAEYRGELLESDQKVVVREARLIKRLDTWNKTTMVLFACDCAEQALSLINLDDVDPRSIEAIRIARLYVVGKATKEEVNKAAEAAARAARAAEAAGAAARAASAAEAAWAAAGAAWAAARAAEAAARAAWAAARAAEAAGAAAKEWQTKRLMQYLNGEI